MNKFLGSALAMALLFLITGCKRLEGFPPPPPSTSSLICPHNQCDVPVNVNVSGANCAPTVPDPIVVDKNGGTLVIRWNAPNGYKFSSKQSPDEGIHYKDGPGPINPNPGWIQGGKAWQVEDTPDPHATSPVKIRYQIHLVADDGSACNGEDPLISNQ